MGVDAATQQVTTALYRYCDAFDAADFDSFASLFEHGHWFAVDQPGSAAVRAYLDENVILYDGSPLTRHEMTNPIVEPSDRPDEVIFRSYLEISQHLPGGPPRLLAQARFRGAFRLRDDGEWSWCSHFVTVDYAGDLSGHIKGVLNV